MNKSIAVNALSAVALAATLTTTTLSPAYAADKEKCYGVALAGQNDCANLAGTHSCAAQSSIDRDIGEWKLVDTGTCKSLGGYSKAEATRLYNEQQS